MAQFSTDFSDSGYSDGNPPPDWSETWDSGYFTWTIEAASGEPVSGSSFGDMVLKGDASVIGVAHALTWDDVGTPADVDLKGRVMPTYAGQRVTGLVARASTDSNGKQGYFLALDVYGNILSLRKIEDGLLYVLEDFDLDTEDVVPRKKIEEDFWYWLRLYVSGTTLRAKVWRDGEDEPASWMIDTTDSAHASGAVGVYASYDSYFDWFGVGTAGSAIPAIPSTEAAGRITQEVVEVLREGSPELRLTQLAVEVLRTSGGTSQPKVVIIG
ncbi:MAG TPA: hypothetical protein ENO22_05605 [candidate division Zixibacteria bacterium]|nr:hypothetical protein [candidate division Zixibacteria bacterium]